MLPLVYLDRSVPAGLEDLASGRVALVGPDPVDLKGAVAVLAGASSWDGSRMDLSSDLRVISRTGIGYDSIDLQAATQRRIVVCNAPESPTISTAEHAMSLLLHATKALGPNQQRLRDGPADYYAANEGMELAGRTIGLVGCGRIGRRVARAAAGLDMLVIASDPYISSADLPASIDVELVSFAELIEASDIISVHCPLTDETTSMFDADAFARMKTGVVFINTARGGLVDQDALINALDSGQIRFAGLDVTTPEPLPPDHCLLARDNVIVTPHIASATDLGRRRMYSQAIGNVVLALSGQRVGTCVNPDVYHHKNT